MDDTADRLADLTDILNGTVEGASPAADTIERHLGSLRLDRIRQLARHLERHADCAIDGVDAIAMRLLLDEYVAALAHLRAATSEASTRLDAAPAAVKDVRRSVNQQLERREKPHASTAPSDQ